MHGFEKAENVEHSHFEKIPSCKEIYIVRRGEKRSSFFSSSMISVFVYAAPRREWRRKRLNISREFPTCRTPSCRRQQKICKMVLKESTDGGQIFFLPLIREICTCLLSVKKVSIKLYLLFLSFFSFYEDGHAFDAKFSEHVVTSVYKLRLSLIAVN